MLMLPRLHRRVRRLLPAGLRTVAVLPPPAPARWECSPLSRLPLGGGRRGMLGLRLEEGVATAIRAEGLDWLRARAETPGLPAMGPWCRLPGSRQGFWTCRDDGSLAWLLDASTCALWLLWQEPSTERIGACR